MTLQFRIFHPIKPIGNNLTPSERIDRISYYLLIPLSICLIIIFNTRSQPIYFNYFCFFIIIILSILLIISKFKRFGEYENLNGYFEGNIIFEEDFLKIKDEKILLSEIIAFDIDYSDYSGKKTYNTRTGPMYTNGVGNQIKIKTKHSSYECYFEIISETLIYNIEQYLYNIVVNRKLQSTKNHLDLVQKNLRENKAFIALLNEVKN